MSIVGQNAILSYKQRSLEDQVQPISNC